MERPGTGQWGWHLLTPDHAKDLLNFMCDMATTTWLEVRRQTYGREGKQKHHDQLVADLPREARRRLGDGALDDVTEMFRFRLTGTQRLW
ncbi:hypothetical protein B1B_12051, partial [mine drainage metagenome]